MISAAALQLSFGRKEVLRDLCLDIEEGSATVIIGRSGIGKSVFLKCVCGLLRPQSGAIMIDGEDICSASERDVLRLRSKIGMLFQEGALFDSMTVYQNIAFPLVYKREIDKREIDRLVRFYAEIVELGDALEAMPRDLSGGMKRRAAIARAMIYEPKYLFYDEPTTGLDPSSSANVEIMIRRLNRERGVTSVIVTHDIELASYLATTVALLDDGRIVAAEPRERALLQDSVIYRDFIQSRRKIREDHE